MSAAYVVDSVRTPFGRFVGALAGVPPDDLAAHAVRALLDRRAPSRTYRSRTSTSSSRRHAVPRERAMWNATPRTELRAKHHPQGCRF